MVDLNTLITGSGVQLTVALSINESGKIAAQVLPNGDMHTFVLVPCGEGEEGCQCEIPSGVTQNGTAAAFSTAVTPGRLNPEMLDSLRGRFGRRNRGFRTWPRK